MKLETIVEWCVLVSKHVLCLWKGDGRDIVKAMFNSWSLARDVTPLRDLAPSNNTFLPALGLASRRAKRIPRAPRSHNLSPLVVQWLYYGPPKAFVLVPFILLIHFATLLNPSLSLSLYRFADS